VGCSAFGYDQLPCPPVNSQVPNAPCLVASVSTLFVFLASCAQQRKSRRFQGPAAAAIAPETSARIPRCGVLPKVFYRIPVVLLDVAAALLDPVSWICILMRAEGWRFGWGILGCRWAVGIERQGTRLGSRACRRGKRSACCCGLRG
jgi:hypothetical protein